LARSSGEPIPLQHINSAQLDTLPTELISRLASASLTLANDSASSPERTASNANITNDSNDKLNAMSTTPDAPTSTSFPNSGVQQQGEDVLVVVPGPLDVIMGRGRHNKNKPGNRRLQQTLEEYYEQYEAADKFEKTVLSEVILNAMVANGSRFLIRDGEKNHGVWVQVSPDKAREKISHDFRNLRNEKKKATDKARKDGEPNKVNGAASGVSWNPKRPRSAKTSAKQNQMHDTKRLFGV